MISGRTIQPSHPELLDKLAKRIQGERLHVKKLCRWITNSRAYQLSSVKVKAVGQGGRPVLPDAAQADDSRAALRFTVDGDAAHRSGSGEEEYKKRDAWLRQFLFTFANDEAEESTSFQGTIPQALMMMNGELMQEALSGQAGELPGRCL